VPRLFLNKLDHNISSQKSGLADEAALAVIAGMATAGAKCLARVRYRRRQLRTAACRGFSSTNSTINISSQKSGVRNNPRKIGSATINKTGVF
jgi:hypothetical protein